MLGRRNFMKKSRWVMFIVLEFYKFLIIPYVGLLDN